jgi:hypothetical protein
MGRGARLSGAGAGPSLALGHYHLSAMALAGRTARRRGKGARWLAAAIVATLLILLVDAALHSRSDAPVQQVAAGQWVDRVLPVIATSNEEGQQLASLWSSAATTGSSEVAQVLQQVSAGAASAYSEVSKLRPPSTLVPAADLLEACLLARSEGAKQLQQAIDAALGAPLGTAPSASEVQAAELDIQTGDEDYQLFQQNLPNLGLSMPASVWMSSPSVYSPTELQVFVTTVENHSSSTPVDEVKIYSLSTSPPPVSMSGSTEVLPDSSTITVTVVVADVGNQQDNNLTITAAISPSTTGTSSVRDFANLSPGQATTIQNMGPLYPPEGTPFTLTVTVTGPAGSSIPPATESMTLSMPAPPPATTTTTVRPGG